jgi:hypothetical protein
MHTIPLCDLINCVHVFCTGFYLCFKQQYLGLNKFVMVSTSIKLALLSTFNMAYANVAKAVFFHIVHSSFSSASVIFSIALHLITLASDVQ